MDWSSLTAEEKEGRVGEQVKCVRIGEVREKEDIANSASHS